MFPLGPTSRLLALLLAQVALDLLEPLALGLLHIAPGAHVTRAVVAGVDRLQGRA